MRRSSRWGSLDRAGGLERPDLVPAEAELEQDLLGVLADLGGPAQRRRPFVELRGRADQRERRPVAGLDLLEVAVGAELRVVEQLGRALHRSPRRLEALQRRAP